MKDPYDNSDYDIDYYFQIKEDIKNFDDLNSFFNELDLLHGANDNYIFRGESNYSGKLQPKLFRKDKNTGDYFINGYDNDGSPYTDTEYENLILRMLKSIKNLYRTFDDMGRHDFPEEFNKINFMNFTNRIDINDFVIDNSNYIGFAQHHGLPTLALDFTHDFKTALYFALTGDYNDNNFHEEKKWECKWIKNDSCLWIMNSSVFGDLYRIKNRPKNASRLPYPIPPLIKADLSYKTNKNALYQKALSVLCLDTYDDIKNFENFCVFEELRENCEIDDRGITLNGICFMGIHEPLIYKVLIPPSLKIEIAEKMNYFRDFNVWHSNNKIIEKMKISKKIFEIWNVDRLYKINSCRPTLDEIFCIDSKK